MNSIQKGSMTVIVSTVIASAAILMTGNSVADGNKIQNEGVEAPVKNNMRIGASVKESSVSLSATTPPPPSGPFLGDGSRLVGEEKDVSASNALTAPKLSPHAITSASQNIAEEPKAPNQPIAPSKPVSAISAKAPQGALNPKAPVADKVKMKATQPVNGIANTAKKAATPIAPKTPEFPVVKKLEKPQKIVKEMIEPSKPEKTINSFKPTAPEMEMTSNKPVKQFDAPKLEKAVSIPKVSRQTPKLQEPVIAKPQMSVPQIKKPLAPVEVQVKKTPTMPKPVINKQRPTPPQNMKQQRPVMPGNMGNRMMPRKHFQQGGQQANSRPPVWQEQTWQQNNYQPRQNGSVNSKQREVPHPAQQGGQNWMMPPKGMYQYAPMYPSDYGYPQMPMWNNNGYNYQMMPNYWPVMPQKMPQNMQQRMPNTNNVQKQGATPPANAQNSTKRSSINGKK